MLPTKNKFGKIDFQTLKNQKTKRVNTDIGFVLALQDVITPIKQTIVLSKKVAKSSVTRNKLKRLFYNSVLELNKEISFSKKSFIFYPNKNFTKEKLQEIIKNICLPQ